MDWAVEVLVTRSELDERRARMAELEQQVGRKSHGHAAVTWTGPLDALPLALSDSG